MEGRAGDNRLNLEEFNVDCLFAHAVLAVVAHHLELKSNDEPVFGILQELLGEVSLFHVVKMEKDVLPVEVREDEPIVLAFVKELKTPRNLILNVASKLDFLSWIVKVGDESLINEYLLKMRGEGQLTLLVQWS